MSDKFMVNPAGEIGFYYARLHAWRMAWLRISCARQMKKKAA